jgi:hypothetical protein
MLRIDLGKIKYLSSRLKIIKNYLFEVGIRHKKSTKLDFIS